MYLSQKIGLYLLACLFTATSMLMSGNIARSQTTRYVNGRKFIKEGEWYKIYQEDKFKIQERVITISLKDGITLQKLKTETNTQNVEFVRKSSLGYIDLRIPESKSPLTVVSTYVNSGLVQTAAVNTYGKLTGDDRFPNDPKFDNDNQWHLEHSDGPDIQATWAWHLDTGEPSSVIAMLDTGTDINHEDLSKKSSDTGNIWTNPQEGDWSDEFDPSTGEDDDDDGNGKNDDWKGWDFHQSDHNVYNESGADKSNHGSWTAGIASALTHNSIGVSGVAGGWAEYEGSAIMPIRVTEPVNNTSTPKTSVLDNAIEYAAKEGADVINMSLTVDSTKAIHDALKAARNNHNALPVAGSGNCCRDCCGCKITYPAKSDYVLAAGGSEQSDHMMCRSARSKEHVVAPGKDIFATDTSDAYISQTGTSASSAEVSGLAGLIRSVHPELDPDSVSKAIKETAKDIEDPGQDDQAGHGRIRTHKAISYVLQNYGGDIGGTYASSSSQNVTLWDNQDFKRFEIQSDDTLTVNSGSLVRHRDTTNWHVYGHVEVQKDSKYLLDVENDFIVHPGGQMIAAGDSAAPVHFGPCGTCSEGWDAIHFDSDGNRFDYTVVTGGNKSVSIEGKNNTLYKTRVKNGWRGISSDKDKDTGDHSTATLKHVIVEANSSVGVVSYFMDPSFDHVTVRYNEQAGVWFYESDTDIFYKSLIDSNAVTDDSRAGIETRSNSSITVYGLDGYDDRGYTRVRDNVKDEIWLRDANDFVLGVESNNALAGGYNAIYPNGNGYDIDCDVGSSFDVFAEYVYWGGDMPNVPGDCNYYISPMLDNDDSRIGTGAQDVPGDPASPPSSAAPITYDRLTTTSTSSDGLDQHSTRNSDVKLLAEAEDPFALARKGGAAVGVERKPLSDEKAQAFGDRMQELRNIITSDTTSRPVRWLNELHVLHIHDESNQTGQLDENRKLFEGYSNKLTSSSSLSSAELAAAELAAVFRVQAKKKAGQLDKANQLIEDFSSEVTQQTHRNLLMERIGILTLKNKYNQAQNTLDEVKELESGTSYHPTLEQILAAKAGSKSKEGVETQQVVQEAPNQFSLKAAYPNPFNPTTTIPFTLAKEAEVKIDVYNLLGRRVATVADGSFEAGRHRVRLKGASLSSGLYIIRARMKTQTGQVKRFTQKITLLK